MKQKRPFRRPLQLHVLLRLAELYGTSTDYLLGRTDVREPYPPSKRRDP